MTKMTKDYLIEISVGEWKKYSAQGRNAAVDQAIADGHEVLAVTQA